MIYLRWLALALGDWLLLPTVPFAAPIVAAMYREQPHGMPEYSWGSIWGTYDNPPQGDEGFVEKRAWYPGRTDGWRGYLNRVHWMIRNPLYGCARRAAVEWQPDYVVTVKGNPDISDKYKIPGWLFARAHNAKGELVAFELYTVLPWSGSRDLRMRLGWKITTDKVYEYGFAQLVNTINPFDGYGEG